MQPVNILVVDDEADVKYLILQKFRKKIADGIYEFSFAGHGQEALEKISKNNSINLILTDINMPVMDGLTLLNRINEINNPILRSIIISAYGDLENIRTAMNRGAYDFITKPIDLNDLEITIEKSLKEIENYKEALNVREKYIAIQHELSIANIIQTSILPKVFPPYPERTDFDIYARMQPALEVGGDLYDFFLIDKHHLAVIIGDVSGKGIAAALLMAVCKTFLKATALKGVTTDIVFSEVNNVLVEDSPSNMFVTAFYGILDTRSGAFEYSNAGHCLPFLMHHNGEVTQLENSGGLILGAIKNAEYNSKVIFLNPGDSIFLYTDGVTEAMNIRDEEFTEDQLKNTLCNNTESELNKIIGGVFDKVHSFVDGKEQSDDITCVMLKFNK